MKLTVITITVIIIIVVAALWYFKSNKSKENFANDLMQNVLQDTQAARQGLNSMMGMINQMQPLINTISPQMPQGMMPQGMMPQGMMPQGMMPQGMMPQGMMPQQTQSTGFFSPEFTQRIANLEQTLSMIASLSYSLYNFLQYSGAMVNSAIRFAADIRQTLTRIIAFIKTMSTTILKYYGKIQNLINMYAPQARVPTMNRNMNMMQRIGSDQAIYNPRVPFQQAQIFPLTDATNNFEASWMN
jgi:Mg2+ and Co2+ transporter CorA